MHTTKDPAQLKQRLAEFKARVPAPRRKTPDEMIEGIFRFELKARIKELRQNEPVVYNTREATREDDFKMKYK